MTQKDNNFLVFSCNSNMDLSNNICNYLNIPLSKAKVDLFSDGEIQVEVHDTVRNKNVFIIQSTCFPVNNNLMELLLMIDAVKRSSAAHITAVVPYYGYARQDRKVAPRVPISAKLVADMIITAGADRIITMDLHAGQIQGFFDIPVDNLYAGPVLLEYLSSNFGDDTVIVSPDSGGVERARAFAKILKADLSIIDKRRSGPNKAEVMAVIGNIEGKKAVIIDDIIDTAGTLVNASEALLENGAIEVHACCTHPVLSGPAIGRINNSHIKSVVITDTIPVEKIYPKIKVVSVADVIGEAIIRSYNGRSITSLFKGF